VGFLFWPGDIKPMKKAKTEQAVCYGWRAVVPATSANLGCAFDCAGLALRLHLQALFIPAESSGLTVEHKGGTPDGFPIDSSNLVLKAISFAAEKLNNSPPSGHVAVESQIPIGVGLGSSAAAVIAGLLLGARYAGQEVSPEQLLRWAEEMEGHVDNAAAAYYGGLVFALCNNIDRIVTAKAVFPEGIRIVAVSPAIAVPTHEARKVLPASYERADVLHTLQRTGLLAATCFSGKFELFPELFDDKLHHPFRQKLVPGIEDCLRLRRPGLMGVAISGSGSSVIAFAESGEVEIAQALQKIFFEAGVPSEVRFTQADNNGAWVTREAVPLADRLGRVLQRVEKGQ
jgi:homoserine kinase